MENSRTNKFDGLSYSEIKAIINEWVIGRNAERDREILCLWLLDGLTYEEIATRYMLAHPESPISSDTVKRTIYTRKPQIFKHFPG